MPITLREDNKEFLFRVCGVLIKDGRILLHETKDKTGWVLPGGRAEINETTSQTVVREFKEELNIEVSAKRMLWVIENFHAYGKPNLHEHGIYYLVECRDQLEVHSNRFAGVESDIDILLTFAWIELSALSDTSIYPKALKELIHHIASDASIKHVVNHDWVSSNDE